MEHLAISIRNLFKPFAKREMVFPEASGGETFNEDYVDFVNNEYSRRQTERKFFELQWRLNMEFLDGNQYLDINPVSMSIEEIPRLNWYQEREVYNQIATIVETRVSKMSRQKPLLKTRPASSDDRDISAAKVTSMLLSSTWHDQDMDSQYEDFISWLEVTGTALWKPIWSKNKGRIIYQGPDLTTMAAAPGTFDQGDGQERPLVDDANDPDQLQPSPPKMIELREGDICTELVPCFEFYPDSSYRRSLRNCRSVIHARAYHIDEIEDMYGVRVDAEDVDVVTLQRSSGTMGGLGYSYGTLRTTVQRMQNHAIVKEYYEYPSRRRPQGRFIVVAGSKTLHAGPMPYMIGDDGRPDYPFVRCVAIDRPGCFWGRSIIERCIPIQRRYNALRNRKAEYMNMVAIGQWTAPVGSLDDESEINNEPGNVMWYRPGINGAKPEPVQFPSLPGSFEKEEQTLLAEFTAISGVSELSRYSEAPSGVKSGVALGIAKEQDDTRIASTVSRVANSTMELGKMWIRLYRQFVSEPRVLRYIGGNREADVREWEVSDLRSDDVFIENMAALAETPSQRRQMVFDLLNAGLFNRPELSNLSEEGRQKVFQLLEFGHWETGHEDDLFLQKSRARRENRTIMDGMPVQVMDFDDHMLHIQMHNRMRMQAEWEELLRTPIGPLANELMLAHIADHIQLALAAMPKEPPPEQNEPPQKESEAS